MIRTSHALFPSVLVIDDNVHLLESYTALLEDEFQVYTATTNEEGLACLQRESIVLVRLGLLLFTMDRLEVLRRVKTIDATVPVIVITAVDEVRRAAAAFKLGARIATLFCCEVSVWLVDALLPSRSALRLRSV